MSDTADHIAARRRLRRRVAFWRIAAILALCVAIGAAGWRFAPESDHVARVEILGVIFDDPVRDDLLREIAEDERARALVVRIDSPGGSVAGSEALYAALRDVAAVKPVVAVMGEVAASGGYIAALAADHIVARGGTITGSIGVVAEYPNVEELLGMIGVEVSRVASAPLKAEPSPFRAPTEEAIAAQRLLIEDSYDWFVALVADRRGMDEARARALGDGRVYTGRQAAENGLIDEIGGEEAALRWLRAEQGLLGDLPVRDRRPEDGPAELLDLAFGSQAAALLARFDAHWAQRPHLRAILR